MFSVRKSLATLALVGAGLAVGTIAPNVHVFHVSRDADNNTQSHGILGIEWVHGCTVTDYYPEVAFSARDRSWGTLPTRPVSVTVPDCATLAPSDWHE